MQLTCPSCKKLIRLKQKYPYHSGFGDQGYLYCSSCPNMVKFSSYNPHFEKLVGDKHPWALSKKEKTSVENHLHPCRCGGRYRFDAPPRCPYCNASIAALLPDPIYFIEIADVVDADKAPVRAWKNYRTASGIVTPRKKG